MNGIFALLFLILSASAHAAFEIPGFGKDCERLFRTVPPPIILDDTLVAEDTLTRMGLFQARLSSLLKRRRDSFPTDSLELSEFRDFLEPDHELSRAQMKAMQAALQQLKAIILFQADFASDYENWVGKIELKQSKPLPQMLLLPEQNVDRKTNTIGGKSLESWAMTGARESWNRIESEMLDMTNLPLAPRGPRTKHDDLNAHHARVPEAYMTWVRAHAEMADFYGFARSRIYYELVAELDIAYAEPVAH